ncbi:hypothetical protein F4805DRAFT_452309 [Annulohypoxylon moriforme]|nr:hypothetical protein F4805DRAFT_452309 [Annulohypoxylon moriforme]
MPFPYSNAQLVPSSLEDSFDLDGDLFPVAGASTQDQNFFPDADHPSEGRDQHRSQSTDEDEEEQSSSLSAISSSVEDVSINWPACLACTLLLIDGAHDTHRCYKQEGPRARKCVQCRTTGSYCDWINVDYPDASESAEQLGPAVVAYNRDRSHENLLKFEAVASDLKEKLPGKARMRARHRSASPTAGGASGNRTTVLEQLTIIAHTLNRLLQDGIPVRIVNNNAPRESMEGVSEEAGEEGMEGVE